jgi:hypothetical protein
MTARLGNPTLKTLERSGANLIASLDGRCTIETRKLSGDGNCRVFVSAMGRLMSSGTSGG